MSFRTTTMVSKGLIYGAGFAVLLPASFYWPKLIVVALVWLLQKPQIIHRHIFPFLFDEMQCCNGQCRYIFSLTQFFQAETFKGNQPTSIWRFRDDRGREAGTIDCPECATTNPVQKGRDCKLVRVTIIGDAVAYSPDEERPSRLRELCRMLKGKPPWKHQPPFPIGKNRTDRPKWRHRLWRWLWKLPAYREVKIPELVYFRQAAVLGDPGMGKSNLFEWQAWWLMNNGQGLTVIDPTGLLIKHVLQLVPKHRRDDVLLIRPRDLQCPFELNPLDTEDKLAEFNLKREFIAMVRSVSRTWGDDIEFNIEHALETSLAVNGSLQDVYDLLTKQTARDRILPQLDSMEHEELLEFWEGWEQMRPKSRTPTIKKLRTMLTHPLLGPMLGAKNSNFDAEAVVRDRKIVLVDLNTRSLTKEVVIYLGTLLIGRIRSASFRQEEEQEIPHTLIIDEARNFMHPGMDLATIYSEARKKRLNITIGCQNLSQIDEVINEVKGAGVLVSFKVDPDDARKVADRIAGVTAKQIIGQDVGQCVVKVHHQGFFVKTWQPKNEDADQTKYIEERMHSMNRKQLHDKESGEGFEVQLQTKVVASSLVGGRVI